MSVPVCIEFVFTNVKVVSTNVYSATLAITPQLYNGGASSYTGTVVQPNMWILDARSGDTFKITSISSEQTANSVSVTIEDVNGYNSAKSALPNGGKPNNNLLGYIFELNSQGAPILTSLPHIASASIIASQQSRFISTQLLIQGPKGTNGTNGTAGATGATGTAGTNGTNGLTGATGTAGTNGTNGLTGATGAPGTNGTNGTNGLTGATGPGISFSASNTQVIFNNAGSLAGSSNMTFNNTNGVLTVSGLTIQSTTIALGASAGFAGQGSNAIAIGNGSGIATQSSNSIIINSTGSALNTNTSGLFIAPIRNLNTCNVLNYDQVSGEISYTSGINIFKNTGPFNSSSTSYTYGDIANYSVDNLQYIKTSSLISLINPNLDTPYYYTNFTNLAASSGQSFTSSKFGMRNAYYSDPTGGGSISFPSDYGNIGEVVIDNFETAIEFEYDSAFRGFKFNFNGYQVILDTQNGVSIIAPNYGTIAYLGGFPLNQFGFMRRNNGFSIYTFKSDSFKLWYDSGKITFSNRSKNVSLPLVYDSANSKGLSRLYYWKEYVIPVWQPALQFISPVKSIAPEYKFHGGYVSSNGYKGGDIVIYNNNRYVKAYSLTNLVDTVMNTPYYYTNFTNPSASSGQQFGSTSKFIWGGIYLNPTTTGGLYFRMGGGALGEVVIDNFETIIEFDYTSKYSGFSFNFNECSAIFTWNNQSTDTLKIYRNGGLLRNISNLNGYGNIGFLRRNDGFSFYQYSSGSIDLIYDSGYIEWLNPSKNVSIIGTYDDISATSMGSLSYWREYKLPTWQLANNIFGLNDSRVKIGFNAGFASGGTSYNTVAVGQYAGCSNQGNNSVAIGFNAGVTNQPQNSIIINATGNVLNTATSGLYMAPIRALTNPSATTPQNVVWYNPSTLELCYQP